MDTLITAESSRGKIYSCYQYFIIATSEKSTQVISIRPLYRQYLACRSLGLSEKALSWLVFSREIRVSFLSRHSVFTAEYSKLLTIKAQYSSTGTDVLCCVLSNNNDGSASVHELFLTEQKVTRENVVKMLRVMILLLYWVFYMPFFESFISIISYKNGFHYMDLNL